MVTPLVLSFNITPLAALSAASIITSVASSWRYAPEGPIYGLSPARAFIGFRLPTGDCDGDEPKAMRDTRDGPTIYRFSQPPSFSYYIDAI